MNSLKQQNFFPMTRMNMNSSKVVRKLKTPIRMARFIDNRQHNIDYDSEDDTDLHLTKNLVIHYIFKSLVMCVFTFGCVFQMGTIIKIFFDYPTTVFVNVQTMNKLFLPGITLCNANRLMISKMKNYDHSFEDRWNALDNNSVINDLENNLKKQTLIDDYLRQMMDVMSVSEFMKYGHTPDDFLVPEFFKCAADKFHPADPCKKAANVITTAQELGNCFTLFHRSRSDILEQNAIDSGLSQSPVRRGKNGEAVNIEIADEPFHPNEIIRLKLDFHGNEYTTLNEPVMGYIMIHDNDEAPVLRQKNFVLTPGNYYTFFLTKQTDYLLPKPYATDCVDHQLTSFDGSQDYNEYLHHPPSRENCIIGCMAQNTMDKCNCWPPELPFLTGSEEEAQENKMKWCDWDSTFNELRKPANLTWFQYCFTMNEGLCNSKCNYDCKIDRYRIVKEIRQWPATERIVHSKDAGFLNEMRKCCAIVSIRYWNAEHTVNRYQPKFEIAEFTSYLGGLLSMWIGFSLLGVYNVAESVLVYIYRKIKHKIKERSVPTVSSVVRPVVRPVLRPVVASNVYNDRSYYDADLRHQRLTSMWKRKAKVAAIIDRWTRSPK